MTKQVSIYLVYATSAVTNGIKKLTNLIGEIIAYGECEAIDVSDHVANNMPSGQASTLNAVLEFKIDDTKAQIRNDVDNTINMREAYKSLMAALNDVFREGAYISFEFNDQKQCELSSEADREDRTFELTDEDKIFVRNKIFGRSNGDKK